jgi:hypothetical protein
VKNWTKRFLFGRVYQDIRQARAQTAHQGADRSWIKFSYGLRGQNPDVVTGDKCPKTDTGSSLNDTQAMNLIRAEMSRTEWSPDTLEVIAAYVRGTGRTIEDVTEQCPHCDSDPCRCAEAVAGEADS